MQHAAVELVLVCQMLHTGDAGLGQGAVIRPPGEDLVDGGIVAGWPAVSVGTGKPCHCMPVYRTHKLRLKTR